MLNIYALFIFVVFIFSRFGLELDLPSMSHVKSYSCNRRKPIALKSVSPNMVCMESRGQIQGDIPLICKEYQEQVTSSISHTPVHEQVTSSISHTPVHASVVAILKREEERKETT
jgi:hypothetical protein